MNNLENEVNDMIASVEQANVLIENAQAQWDRYLQLKKDVVTAGRTNPFMNEKIADQIIRYADNFKSEFGNVALMESAVFLIKQVLKREEIERIIKTAYDMAIGGVIYYNIAVEVLVESLRCDTDRIGVIYPEIKDMSGDELADGKAIDYIADKLGEKNGL
jgi:hypothetical protein